MTSTDETIEARISESRSQAARYKKWLNRLKIPNTILIGGGSLAAFIGGAIIVAQASKDFAGYMALFGGALTGLHGWFGCEAHQQKCRSIAATYLEFALRYEGLRRLDREKKEDRFDALEDMYAEFTGKIDAEPWIY